MLAWSPLTESRTRWARWRALGAGDRRRLLALAVLLPLIDLALRSAGFVRTQRWLTRHGETRPLRACTPQALAEAERLAQLASIAGRHGAWTNTCLRQALVVQWWLRREGLPAQLRIGAQRGEEGLQAHAWVELEGMALAQGDSLPPAFR